jgi:transcriptional regulator with XRE-family HTH domain
MKIGEHIKDIRVSKGLTQVELSEQSGIALRTIQRIEKNEVTPSIYSLNAIGEILGVKLNEMSLKENNKKFEFRIVVSNVNNLFEDSKVLFKRNWRILLFLASIATFFILFSEIKSLVYNFWDDSKVTLATINCQSQNECDIELTKKNATGKIIWKKTIGGTSYDKAGQVVKTKEGDYLVVGSTSSFGKGNYDVLIVKVSPSGELLWQKTYGDFLNDYGLKISLVNDDLYLIEATKQICKTVNVSNDCIDQEWLFKIDDEGNIK